MIQDCLRLKVGFATLFLSLSVAGCHRSSEPASAEASKSDAEATSGATSDYAGVVVDAETVRRLGVEVADVTVSNNVAVAHGTAVVLDSAALTIALADLEAARSDAAIAQETHDRLQRLYLDDGNASRQAVEAAKAQLVSTRARVTALEARARADWGSQLLPIGSQPPVWLEDLATGKAVLLRAEFVGALPANAGSVGFSLLGTEPGMGTALTIAYVGRSTAPAQSAVGVGVLLRASIAGGESTLRPGERLSVIATSRSRSARPLIPAAAAFADGGRFWCYVERTEGRFDRVPLASTERIAGGYPVSAGVKVGDHVVVRAAPLLLSLERGSGSVADEE